VQLVLDRGATDVVWPIHPFQDTSGDDQHCCCNSPVRQDPPPGPPRERGVLRQHSPLAGIPWPKRPGAPEQEDAGLLPLQAPARGRFWRASGGPRLASDPAPAALRRAHGASTGYPAFSRPPKEPVPALTSLAGVSVPKEPVRPRRPLHRSLLRSEVRPPGRGFSMNRRPSPAKDLCLPPGRHGNSPQWPRLGRHPGLQTQQGGEAFARLTQDHCRRSSRALGQAQCPHWLRHPCWTVRSEVSEASSSRARREFAACGHRRRIAASACDPADFSAERGPRPRSSGCGEGSPSLPRVRIIRGLPHRRALPPSGRKRGNRAARSS